MKLVLFLSVFLAHALAQEDFDDEQKEFYLPYSETEDVDFSLSQETNNGCYQWSTNNTEVIRLHPIHTNYEMLCGSRLEFQIIPKAAKGKITIKITAENADNGYDSDAPALVEYLLHVRPVAKLEVMGLKTEMEVGDEPAPFGVAGYDEDDNEFDTLDGVQIAWYIGSKREVASFQKHNQMGPIVKVIAHRAGKGAVMALLNDPNYEHLDPATMEFSVKAPLMVEPDGVFLLEGGMVNFKLLEKGIDQYGKTNIQELDVTSVDSDYTFEIKEPEIAVLDKATSNVTALAADGETTLFVKNSEGEIVKGVPVRITTAHKLLVKSYPDPDSNQLILGHTYDIQIEVFNRDERPIYPSKNILCKTTFPKQFEVIEISENGLFAKVRAESLGLGKIKASLRSVLAEDDEELEIVPHVKGSTDFEIYESVVIKPRETILPWDENSQTSFELKYTATGGGKVYTWSTDNEDLATIDNEGKATTHGGPGEFTVTAAMVKGAQNYDQAKVYLLPVTQLEFKDSHLEVSTTSPLTLALRMFTFLKDDEEPVMFTDCADVPFKIALSDNKNYQVETTHERGNNRVHDSCASFVISAKTPGTTCKVTVSYVEPSTGRNLKAVTHISTYRNLETIFPAPNPKSNNRREAPLIMSIGSSSDVVFRGGPTPWMSKPSAHYKQVEVDDPEIVKVSKISETEIAAPVLTGSYSDVTAYKVTCLSKGTTLVTFLIGNTPSTTNKHPIVSAKEVTVQCDMPAKLVIKAEPRNHELDDSKYVANPETNKIMAYNHKDLLLTLTVKNEAGETFHKIDSLRFNYQISDEDLLKPTTKVFESPAVPLGPEFGILTIPGKAFQSFSPQGKKGPVEIEAYLDGYNEEVLKAAGIENPEPLPKVILDDDEDMEDEEEFNEHSHHLIDSLDFELASDAEVSAVRRRLNANQ